MSLPSFTIDPDLRELGFELARGNVRDWVHHRLVGVNPDVDAASDEDVSDIGDLTYPSSGEALEIVSSDANDTSGGTGAQTVRIRTLDANWNLYEEELELNGTTAVTVDGTHLRSYSVEVLTAGSGGTNAGTLTLRVASGGATRMQVRVGLGRTFQGAYTIPGGYKGYIRSWKVRLLTPIPASAKVNVKMLIREHVDTDGAWVQHEESVELGPLVTEYRNEYPTPIEVDPITDIKFLAGTSIDNTLVEVEADIVSISLYDPDPRIELSSFVNLALAAGETEIFAGQNFKRPFVLAGSTVDLDGLATSIKLLVGGKEIVSNGALPVDWIGEPGENVSVLAVGSGTGKYWITCGLIDQVLGGEA